MHIYSFAYHRIFLCLFSRAEYILNTDAIAKQNVGEGEADLARNQPRRSKHRHYFRGDASAFRPPNDELIVTPQMSVQVEPFKPL